MEFKLLIDEDIPRLHEIRTEYVSDRCLPVVRTGVSPEIGPFLYRELP